MTVIKRFLLPALVLGIASGGLACSGGSWQSPDVVTIQSDKEVAALIPSWVAWLTVAEPGRPQALLLRDGDFIVAGEVFVRYRASDGRDLTITGNHWSGKIGDKVVTVVSDEDGSAWLAAASDSQLADLRTLGVDDVNEATLLAIRRLAAVNPTVDLMFDDNTKLTQVMPLFHPRAVFAPERGLDEAARNALAGETSIDMLVISADDPGRLDFLGGMPRLRTLVLDKWKTKDTGPLPAGLTGLKTLMVMEQVDFTDLKSLAASVPNLEALSLVDAENLKDLSGIEKMTRLNTFYFWSEEISDLDALANLKDLRWVGLPHNLSQDRFAAFVAAHPALEIVEMMKNEGVTDLTPLASLKGLHGLILDGEFDDLDAVQKLTSLRFLGVSKRIWDKMPNQVAAAQKALPDALVVQVKPLCLGSGWILLLVPVPLVAWLIRRRRGVRIAE